MYGALRFGTPDPTVRTALLTAGISVAQIAKVEAKWSMPSLS